MNDIKQNTTPWGLTDAHIKDVISSKSIITFKEHEQDSVYKITRDVSNRYLKLWQNLSNDPGYDQKSKLKIIAKEAKSDLDTLVPIMDTVANKAEREIDSILSKAHDPVDTAKTKEIRTILRSKGVNKAKLISLIDESPDVLEAVLTSPLAKVEYDLDDKELGALSIKLTEHQIGEEGVENLEKHAALKSAATSAKKSLESKLGHIIEVNNKSEYKGVF